MFGVHELTPLKESATVFLARDPACGGQQWQIAKNCKTKTVVLGFRAQGTGFRVSILKSLALHGFLRIPNTVF